MTATVLISLVLIVALCGIIRSLMKKHAAAKNGCGGSCGCGCAGCASAARILPDSAAAPDGNTAGK